MAQLKVLAIKRAPTFNYHDVRFENSEVFEEMCSIEDMKWSNEFKKTISRQSRYFTTGDDITKMGSFIFKVGDRIKLTKYNTGYYIICFIKNNLKVCKFCKI